MLSESPSTRLWLPTLALATWVALLAAVACGTPDQSSQVPPVTPTALTFDATRTIQDSGNRHFSDESIAESILGWRILQPDPVFYSYSAADGLIFSDETGTPSTIRQYFGERKSGARLVLYQSRRARDEAFVEGDVVMVNSYEVRVIIHEALVTAHFATGMSIGPDTIFASVEARTSEEAMDFIASLGD